MRMYDIIDSKRLGAELSDEQIRYAVREYTDGNIPDYQMSALLMAVCLNGMNAAETSALTDAMARSGRMLDLSELGENTADKHSTGGVGDKTTLVVAPLAACLGCKVVKMSGRGLGYTGGTIDKLEAIKGFKTSLSIEQMLRQARSTGVVVAGQSAELAPADKKIYALRDVTATVESIPLIASSIMSKKLASGAKCIVFDVKAGSGAFMKTAADAQALARTMVDIGTACGRRVCALITDMDVPLGSAVGNALEVKEAVAVLRGQGPADLADVCVELAARMGSLCSQTPVQECRDKASAALRDGRAFDKFCQWVQAQGGDISCVLDTEKLGSARVRRDVICDRDGYICAMNTERIGMCASVLGAGRERKDDPIDPAAGIVIYKKSGQRVHRGDVLATLHTEAADSVAAAESEYLAALSFADTAPQIKPHILAYVE